MNGRFLALDVGAGKIFLSEYALGGSAPELVNVAVAERDPIAAAANRNEPLVDLADTVKQLMASAGIKPAPLCVMLSGQQVFLRFSKIQGGADDFVAGMIRDEAAEHLPVQLDQAVWDSTRLSVDSDTGEIDTLIVATKTETAADAAALAEAVGLPLASVDAIPLALCNSVRMSMPDLDGCTLVLDIGARATNLVFLEGDKVFLRSIPIAGNTMTNEIARSLAIEPAEAEVYKKESGFVSLGGVTGTDDERADRASKVLRNVATRLHSEITRSINFYRSQQGGSAPVRVLLSGGASLTRHLDTFFREKLGVDVDFFNPFTTAKIGSGAAADDTTLFLLAPSVGAAWRECGHSPLSINLVPPEIVAKRRFKARIPFFGASVAALALSIVCWGVYAGRLAESRERQATAAKKVERDLKSAKQTLDGAASRAESAVGKADAWAALALSRASWPFAIEHIRRSLPRGAWLVSVSQVDSSASSEEPGAESAGSGQYGALRVVARGYKSEMDKLPGKGSAGEKMLSNLLRGPRMFTDGKVDREPVVADGRVTELQLTLDLARPLGRPDVSWIPPEPSAKPAAAADGEGDDDSDSEGDA